MQQTPIHDEVNQDLLKMIPVTLKRVIEVGSSSGALARAYRSRNPACKYVGIEIDPDYAECSRNGCTEVLCGNIESFSDDLFMSLFPSDCWIFGDVLEHLYDPWAVLRRIRAHLPDTSQIIACIPNAQHWSVQASLNRGLFVYQDSGLLDRTHIRWFTRKTIVDLFESTGYRIVYGMPRIFNFPDQEKVLPAIRAMALASGADPQEAVDDSLPFQWVVRAVPA